jgi:hypothetical protein
LEFQDGLYQGLSFTGGFYPSQFQLGPFRVIFYFFVRFVKKNAPKFVNVPNQTASYPASYASGLCPDSAPKVSNTRDGDKKS